MNSADSHRSPHTVSRPAFVAHFLDVLDQTMTLKISPDEAAATYDEIVAGRRKEILYERMLYDSSLSYFLSELEILTLIKVRNMVFFIAAIDYEFPDPHFCHAPFRNFGLSVA
jgi:hypothetical protein